MLRLHFADGRTEVYDLGSQQERLSLQDKLRSRYYQDSLTAATVSNNGSQVSLVRPSGFESPSLQVDALGSNGKAKGGCRLVWYAGDATVTVMSHTAGPARVSVARTGRRIYNPDQGGEHDGAAD